MKSLYLVTKELALLLSGAFLAILVIPFEAHIPREINLLTVLLIMLTLYGIGLADWLTVFLFWALRKLSRKRKLVGIFLPFPISNSNSSWVDVDIDSITSLLKQKLINYQIFNKLFLFRGQCIVVNPFGGVYPEEDVSFLSSLGAIFDFVRSGGVYINIADIPFYYAFDKKLNRRIDTTPLAGDFSAVRSFFQTILTRKLHCFVLGMINLGEVERVIELSNSGSNLYSAAYKDEQREFSPVLKIPFGKGYFIFSTLHLNLQNLEANLSRVIDAAQAIV